MPKQAATPVCPIANPQKAAKRAKMTLAEQRVGFGRVACEHGTDQDEEAFKGVLRKLGKPVSKLG